MATTFYSNRQQKSRRSLHIALLTMALFALCMPPVQAQQKRTQLLRQHLYLLASDSLAGRLAGSEGGYKARHYIIEQYKNIGLQPYRDSLTHTFTVENNVMSTTMGKGTLQNIVAIIPGNDPALKDEYIVLGAHYDHVGVKNGKVYNGADDNASGSSALIEIARELYAHRSELKRSIIIAAFDAEEEGLHGSKALVQEMTKNGDIKKVKLMMSIDMVGWYQATGHLTMEGSGTLKDANKVMQGIAEDVGLVIRLKGFEHSIMTATDTEPFAKAQCPTLAVTTGLKSPYHKPEDDADLIDYENMDRICQYISRLTLSWADGSTPLSASGQVAKKHQTQLSPWELGVSGAIGNANLTYPGSALIGKNGISAALGVSGRWNIANHLALQADALFNLYRIHYPDIDGNVNDVFNDKYHKLFTNITIPVTMLFCTEARSHTHGYLGVGFFVSPLFNSDYKFQNNFLAGPQWRIGLRSNPLDISIIQMYNINNVDLPTLPTIFSVHTHLQITFYL